MDYKCGEESFKICQNNAKCFLCDGARLYKEPAWMKRQKQQEEKKAKGIKKKPKEGMSFEKRVQKAYNNLGEVARRRPNSGAIWCMPGDIVTKNELFECKERGSVTSRGEKTITIQKQQLDKVREEAAFANKNVWYYVFGFKNCNDIYVTKDFNDELAMIEQIEILKNRIKELEENGKNDD